ncbi:hypothetical protein SELMODRAFT_182492 [Selaginella moellendorffii]|uniref:Uncharacterized protein COP9-2 n=1 Tax=Selaginella moellendorffii TaxID=88036 RepID=D8STE7_SELML|nr:COP9 signalosome complex subunit 8 isoform X2 [Selaginella moellendorffii]XP_024516115.1 COP9 signalosome complex subunit 8 isoform X2 [Selaginella moellendorffii]EFJ12386.1 hypothetical protein SELMODRAFT_182492 [Selaginella moellendorffii]|eukprot:XP_002986529.1 COP9 signalosome complex subunit 8 isoform X2 [Selaginella moellendorffii]
MGAEVHAVAPVAGAMDINAVRDLIAARRFNEIAAFCESLELEYAARGSEHGEDWPYAIHILGHIYNSDLDSARFLWKRIPDSIKQSQMELAQVWKIGQCMWTHDYVAVHEAIRGFDWTPDVKQVVAAVAEDFSRKIFRLLSTAYSTLSIPDAASFFGLTESETIALAEQQGWILDPTSQMFNVRSIPPTAEQKLDTSNLQNLTEYVFHLEH